MHWSTVDNSKKYAQQIMARAVTSVVEVATTTVVEKTKKVEATTGLIAFAATKHMPVLSLTA
jgi:hypothetical protein